MAGPVANIVGISFVDIATTRMDNIQATLDAVIAAENNVLFPILKALFIIYISRQFLLTMAGDLSMQRFFATILRSGIIILLVTHNGAFVQYVREPVFNRIPQAGAAMITGDYGATTAGTPLAARFDAIAAKGDAVTSEVDIVSNSVFSITDWRNSISAHIANGGFQTVLAIIVYLWLLGQTLLAIILALGLPAMCFEIFERTRGFVDQFISKIVGFVAFGFATSFVLAAEMHGMQTMLDNLHAQAAINASATAGVFWHVVSDSILDMLTMAILPGAVAFGSGAATSLGAPAAMAAMRTLTAATGGAASAAGALARRSFNTVRKA